MLVTPSYSTALVVHMHLVKHHVAAIVGITTTVATAQLDVQYVMHSMVRMQIVIGQPVISVVVLINVGMHINV
jgi:hypothetical protein